MEDYKKKYEQAIENLKKIKAANKDNNELVDFIEYEYPELKESNDEKIRKELIKFVKNRGGFKQEYIAWLEKQGEQKEINLVEILKHYPRETELYSPLYGKLWLAEVNEEHGIITCYKYPLEEDCTRAILEQEDTVSFYSNGTTGLPDFSVSKDCMLFLYDSEKQGEKKELKKIAQKPISNLKWDELTWKDVNTLEEIINEVHYDFRNGIGAESFGKEVLERFREIKGDEYVDTCEQKPTWSEEDEMMLENAISSINHESVMEGLKSRGISYSIDSSAHLMKNLVGWLKSLKERMKGE